ncbi:Hypothetical protein NGAL_HAMBI2427_58960 [Neorhizobium galegae bv. orientalis]|uniref:Uncharacterized protein n=1 Tax=Neorhizobium galegae bv. orientalis str. HAMBI 540 TaxID=1028800 RepID=A0A068T2G3_NEOGA|nr:Hypothetical protein RG540_PA09990 [Neorhizobium galegae bv. orientalis str. HAMBI 540]CDZ54944.1 Hypothetical protein NGAL_HAMBI2427_58960 [Neorhizobium galegae bv. orientalis]
MFSGMIAASIRSASRAPICGDGWARYARSHCINVGQPSATIGILTQIGRVDITTIEWQMILLAACEYRQPLYQTSFDLQATDRSPGTSRPIQLSRNSTVCANPLGSFGCARACAVRQDAGPQPDARQKGSKRRGLGRLSRSSPQRSLGEGEYLATSSLAHHPPFGLCGAATGALIAGPHSYQPFRRKHVIAGR